MLLAAGCEVGARAWLRPELLLIVAAQGVLCLLARRAHLAGAGRRRLGGLTPRLRRLSRPRTTGRPGSRVTRCGECTVHCRACCRLASNIRLTFLVFAGARHWFQVAASSSCCWRPGAQLGNTACRCLDEQPPGASSSKCACANGA